MEDPPDPGPQWLRDILRGHGRGTDNGDREKENKNIKCNSWYLYNGEMGNDDLKMHFDN